VEIWNDIAYISRHTYHVHHILLYEFLIAVFGNIIRNTNLLRALVISVQKQKSVITFSEIPPNETKFFVNIFRKSCNLLETIIARSTILSKLRSVHYYRIEISSVPTTQRAL